MAGDLIEKSEGLLNGRLSIEDHFPITMETATEAYEIDDGLAFIESFANVTAIDDGGELALIDAGSVLHAQAVHDVVRTWSGSPLRKAVYTHGHVDHCFGVPAFEAEPDAPQVEVVSHEAVSARFDRYRMTNGYNGVINMRQFRLRAPLFPMEFRYPDRTYRDETAIEVGEVEIVLRHDKGETDDHTWAWLPQRRTICTGDLFVWVSPNCGNPQKVQRYPIEWAAALRKMADLEPELLLPGHGLPISGADNVAMVLGDTAELLESITARTLEMMNEGARLDDIVHEVEPPAELMERPWLQPVYDEPEFIVHNLWRLYGGWYDGDPSHLKPAPAAALAAELASLAGGADRLSERAAELAGAGDLRLAGHLAELATQADPASREAHGVRAEVYRARVRAESSLMAKGIFGWAEHESAAIARGADEA